ncbi:hypothetical protein OOT46_09525 [Aquabacterium sp. A7-Y]|uniref:hypothetical protein n=1 Tax=Aquabacterium sp. A7-Y TaxID=1349605 RepID=UPI00223D4423|nr:hypothetical protein [Aquabacterium sp. A7-Y]MCW7538087.1 hypothetical protein [Aquabacterium sp. A7-Y]
MKRRIVCSFPGLQSPEAASRPSLNVRIPFKSSCQARHEGAEVEPQQCDPPAGDVHEQIVAQPQVLS